MYNWLPIAVDFSITKILEFLTKKLIKADKTNDLHRNHWK